MTTILIAPDKFKGSLSAKEVCFALRTGIIKERPNARVVCVPLADGGEGMIEALLAGVSGKSISAQVTGPLGRKVQASFVLIDNAFGSKGERVALIEIATASGLSLVAKEKRDPLITTTFGTGELILFALNEDPTKILIGIGGSATTDGGMGMAQALGARFFDFAGAELGLGSGALLERIARIDLSNIDDRAKRVKFLVASDVKNPLYGPNGAAFIYAPQKGASSEGAARLDRGLRNFARVIEKDLKIDVADQAGAGAAGGLGAGLIAFLNAELRSGVDLVMDIVGLKEKMASADLIITGEGKLDSQTFFGKVPLGVLKLAAGEGVKCILVAGTVEDDARDDLMKLGAIAIYSVLDRAGGSAKESIGRAPEFLEAIGRDIALNHLS